MRGHGANRGGGESMRSYEEEENTFLRREITFSILI